MMTDATLFFVPPGAPLSLVGAAGQSIPSPNLVDILSLGAGIAPASIIGTSYPTFGSDSGIGGDKPQIEVVLGTQPVTSNSCTLNVALQGAADSGLAGGYQPGTWQTLVETGPMTAAQLTSGAVVARFDYPPAFPNNLRPRFYRLLFQVPATGSFTAGTISFATIALVRDDTANLLAQNNYTVA